MQEVTVRTVTGRSIAVEVAADTAQVSDVLTKACTEAGYVEEGAKLVVKGVGLAQSALLKDVLLDGCVPTFIAVKRDYRSLRTRESTGDGEGGDGSGTSGGGGPVYTTPSRERGGENIDLTLPQYDGPFDLPHRQGLAQLQAALARTAESEVLNLLYIHPTMVHLRVMVQADPSLLAPALRQAYVLTPLLIEFASAKNGQFLALLNEPPQQRRRSSSSSLSSQDDGLGQADYSSVGPEDIESLNRIHALGPFPRELVLQAYLDAGRNELLAAQYLIELSSYEPAALTQSAEDELDALRARAAAAEESGDAAGFLCALATLGVVLAREGSAEAEPVLLRALSLSLAAPPAAAAAAEAQNARAAGALAALYSHATRPLEHLVLHEAAALLAVSARGVSVGTFLRAGACGAGAAAAAEPLSLVRFVQVARREGVDLVFVHAAADGQLAVWQVRHDEADPAAAVVARRAAQLSAEDVRFLAGAPEELSAALSAASPQRGWAVLHRLYLLLFGEGGCADWLPSRVCFCSTLPLPFHALAPHGGVPLARGRQVTQAPSVLWLQAAQDLALARLERPPGRKRLLRSAYVGNTPGYVAAKKVPESELAEEEPVAVAHLGLNTSGGETVAKLDRRVDTAVFAAGVSADPMLAAWDADKERLWACTTLVSVLPGARTPSPPAGPAPRPVRDSQLLLQGFYAAMARGEGKPLAYCGSLAVGPETHLRAWVPWILSGTRLLLGGKRAHVASEKIKATDDYRYLEAHSMHIVFDKMIGHLLEAKPGEPLSSLLEYMEEKKRELESIGGSTANAN
eukprot:Rhum_TRINITY_DN15268_c0_g2::Rhum_TRINITY_DN15268_c0_g2_i1::g.147489::m.147489